MAIRDKYFETQSNIEIPILRDKYFETQSNIEIPILRDKYFETQSNISTSTDIGLINDGGFTDIGVPINVSVLNNDQGLIGGETLTIFKQGLIGTAVVNGDGVSIDYTPNPSVSGRDAFFYDVDASGSPAAVNIFISTSALTPIDDTTTTHFNSTVNILVLNNDLNVVGGETITITTQPSNGTATVNGDGVTIDYTPNGVFTGIDVFQYDLDSSGNPANVQVTVTGTLGFSGNIVETTNITDWIVHAYTLDGVTHDSQISTGSSYAFPATVNEPYFITGFPNIKHVWKPGLTIAAGEFVTSTAIPHIWKALGSGTTNTIEPNWNLSGNTTDNDITWEYVDEMVEPKSQGPMLPYLY